MEEFFEKGTIPEEDLIPALHEAIREDQNFPGAVCLRPGQHRRRPSDGLHCRLHARALRARTGAGRSHGGGNGEPPTRKVADTEPVSLYVFKTVSDPFAGRISYFKVFSGVLKNDATLQNFTRSTPEKLAHISIMQGKTAVPVHGTACGRHRRGGQTERHVSPATRWATSRRRFSIRESSCRSRRSRSPSSPRPAPTKTSWAPACTS